MPRQHSHYKSRRCANATHRMTRARAVKKEAGLKACHFIKSIIIQGRGQIQCEFMWLEIESGSEVLAQTHTHTPSKTRKSCSISAEKREERERGSNLSGRAGGFYLTNARFLHSRPTPGVVGNKNWEDSSLAELFLSQRGNLRDFFYRLRAPDKKSSVWFKKCK
jgi:hypothetical protein